MEPLSFKTQAQSITDAYKAQGAQSVSVRGHSENPGGPISFQVTAQTPKAPPPPGVGGRLDLSA